MPNDVYEIRCPIHGFIALNGWERTIIDDPAFQRLRRIKQLAWTEQLYPGATHNRFEHSLGVMHTATLLFDSLVRNSEAVLLGVMGYNNTGLERSRQLVRLAALLHDVGHSPFSHASEELFPEKETGQVGRHVHEEYSAAIVRGPLKHVIDSHPHNEKNHALSADDVASLIEGTASTKQGVFWRDLISGQMDADRMDYLLRDSYHAGVSYGQYDLRRVVNSMRVVPPTDRTSARLGIDEGGWHAAEALVLARYFMFTQVYFHKTRVAYDIHIREAMKALLPGGCLPRPTGSDLDEFLRWDDWRVLGMLSDNAGGDHGRRLAARNHYRLVYQTPEVRSAEDDDTLSKIKEALGELLLETMPASKSWYKTGKMDIPVYRGERGAPSVQPLSSYSKIIGGMKSNNQVLLYCDPQMVAEASKIVERIKPHERPMD